MSFRRIAFESDFEYFGNEGDETSWENLIVISLLEKLHIHIINDHEKAIGRHNHNR